MESDKIEPTAENTTTHKQQCNATEEDSDLIVNGDGINVNGGYKSEVLPPEQPIFDKIETPNGDVIKSSPSQENGIADMEVDAKVDPPPVPVDEMELSDDDADEEEEDEEAEVEELPYKLQDSENGDDIAVIDSTIISTEKTTDKIDSSVSLSPDPPIDTCVQVFNENTNFDSKKIDEYTKLGVRNSLEITLVKKEPPSFEKEIEVVTILDDSKDFNTTPEKGSEEDDPELSQEKSTSKKKKIHSVNITPRRSSRNINKNKSYADLVDDSDKKSDDDVQEIIPTDPLADDKKKIRKTTIVVNDTKKLVEIAAGSKQIRSGKKEPTLVIIDTNSILSGKGAIPVTQQSQTSIQNTSISQLTGFPSSSRPGFSMVAVNQNTFHNKSIKPSQSSVLPSQPKPIVLPSLTDDMFVVEAPSFIVPYVYEKPPVTPLKEYVDNMEKFLKEIDKEEKRKKKEKDKNKEKGKSGDSDDISEKIIKEEDKSSDDIAINSNEDHETSSLNQPDKDDADANKITDATAEGIIQKQEIPEPVDEDLECEIRSSKEDKRSERSDTETDEEGKESDSSSKKDSDSVEIVCDKKKKSDNYFENPLGKFFMQIGVNLVQEHVQTDLLRNQKRKRDREGKSCPVEVHMAIGSLLRTLEFSKENNKPFKLEMHKCKLCNFRTESALVMAHHLETPHMRNYVYRCNFCTLEVRSPHDILFHMEAEHNVRGRLERAPAYHQCPNCPFEDNQKGKLSRHLLSCAKKYKPERNQEPPMDWEPPAKIPRVRGSRMGLSGSSLYTASLAPRAGVPMGRLPSPSGHSLLAPRGRGRPPIYINRTISDGRSSPHHKFSHMRAGAGMVFRPSGSTAQPQVLLPSPYSNLYQVENEPYRPLPLPVALVSNIAATSQKSASASSVAAAAAGATAKLLNQPSISITPLPRQASGGTPPNPQPQQHIAKPGRPPGSSKSTFVICEICDGYIKDLEQLRNHMQWIHKVKIHPKMIYNRPPLNCQKCQFRFFTDQGLERHLLGSHGLVTSSMQEAANKGKDGGRCPVCGRVYQWKLLNHVARDHNLSLKPAHLSYKCTVCTATFSMYKQFEGHVYSAHSVVAKRVIDKKSSTPQPSTSCTSQLPSTWEMDDDDDDDDSQDAEIFEDDTPEEGDDDSSDETDSTKGDQDKSVYEKLCSMKEIQVNKADLHQTALPDWQAELIRCKTPDDTASTDKESSDDLPKLTRKPHSRDRETPEQRLARLERDRIRKAFRIRNETPEQRADRLIKDRVRKAFIRQYEPYFKRQARLERERVRKAIVRRKELLVQSVGQDS